VYLFGPVAGRVTGAVFLGDGTLHIEPPSAMERRQLKALMKTEVLEEHFTSAVFDFTDGTGAELKRAAKGTAAPDGTAQAHADDTQKTFRQELKYNLEARLLEDMLGPVDNSPQGEGVTKDEKPGFFLADVRSGAFSKRLLFFVDPNGALAVAPEEVALLTSSTFGYDITLGFHSAAALKSAPTSSSGTFKITHQSLDLGVEKGGKITGTAVTLVTANKTLQVLPLDLAPPLRVTGVWGPEGEALDFVQEDKLKDADLAVVLTKPLQAGQSVQITTQYAGKDAVTDEGSNNYYLAARENWYPNVRSGLGNYAIYDMTFHTPRQVQVVATGNKVSDRDDGKLRTSIWTTPAPIAVAGFNLGEFKAESDHNERNKNVEVASYANLDLADRYKGIANAPGMAVGTLSTTGMLKRATSEGSAAILIYTDYFGPLPYDHVYLTQQTACNYGQSWPMLVYLPICYFWDATIQHEIGVRDQDATYWNVVTAHEVAHQWWGQTVGFNSYRDQWMSEGFANYSASLFLLKTRTSDKEYRDFWALLRKRLLDKNVEGVRPVDVGPVVMGTRANSSKAGNDVYQQLVYDKGAYILHSLEMLYWTPKYGDAPFKQAMHDFVTTYRNKPATTEDFKAVMERNMPPWADADGNHRLDWFFNAYVYGSATPHYTITNEFSKKDENTIVHFAVTQSNVPADFKMLVPIYVQTADQKTVFLGHALVTGDATVEQTLSLGKIPTPKTLLLNYNFDLLTN
jgi:Peptidase family M1 domain